MGKRKSRRLNSAPTKVVPKLEVYFTCPFCNYAESVECTFDRKHNLAEAECWVCKARYATTIHRLTEPIDIYSEWLDKCEEVKKEAEESELRRPTKRIAV
ncbi:hypothetical protein Cni_G07562 [Canna indica]|uniref:Transcription elongation factor 1 homolog n=1 Tax=Canna indica TaxID=4628 RepID=A0AAQ3Q4Z7_9LILI|nr:hypothetical protein Cni_G07562 [Canna indica]